jgi:hypothetical protein
MIIILLSLSPSSLFISFHSHNPSKKEGTRKRWREKCVGF